MENNSFYNPYRNYKIQCSKQINIFVVIYLDCNSKDAFGLVKELWKKRIFYIENEMLKFIEKLKSDDEIKEIEIYIEKHSIEEYK